MTADACAEIDPERHEIDLLLALAPSLGDARVLEVGCGDGRLTRRYSARASRVLAIDRDAPRIAVARASAIPGDVTFLVSDIADLDPRSGPFDVIILSWAL